MGTLQVVAGCFFCRFGVCIGSFQGFCVEQFYFSCWFPENQEITMGNPLVSFKGIRGVIPKTLPSGRHWAILRLP